MMSKKNEFVEMMQNIMSMTLRSKLVDTQFLFYLFDYYYDFVYTQDTDEAIKEYVLEAMDEFVELVGQINGKKISNEAKDNEISLLMNPTLKAALTHTYKKMLKNTKRKTIKKYIKACENAEKR